jgi:hypothetical protein
MDFKEFIENEEAALFDIGLEQMEQMDEVLSSTLKFAGGAGGNLISQLGRGVGNLASGLARGAVGTGQTAIGGLQLAGGGSKTGRETLRKGISNLGGGASSLGRGAFQLGGALSGVTPVLRGAQAASEPLGISGIYAPSSKNRTRIQDLFGLNSWEKLPEERPEEREQPKKITRPNNSKPKVQSTEDRKTSRFLRDLSRKERGLLPQPEAWRELVAIYKVAKTSQERKAIRKKMRETSPQLYQQAVERGSRLQKK